MRTHDEKWLKTNALFGCVNPNCAEEVSYPAHMLHVTPNNEPVCESCWDELFNKEPLSDVEFAELEPFKPFSDK